MTRLKRTSKKQFQTGKTVSTGTDIEGIPAGGDLDGTYASPTIRAGAVTTPKIADGAVTTPKIADDAVTTPKLADASVTDDKIVDVDWLKIFGAPSSMPPSGAAGGELAGTYPNPTVLNSTVLNKVLTGLNVIGSSIINTDSVIDAFGKLQNQINNVLGGAIYQGVWNALTNTPTLVDGTGTKGFYYVVSVDGVRNLGSGAIDFKHGDWAIYNGATWDKVDNTDAVSSVNGFIGAVSLTTADIPEVTNLYWTIARFNAAFATKTTTDLAEGTNLYYTATRFNAAFAAKNTDNLAEGVANLYWTLARFTAAFAGKTTTDLTEGSNLYYTAARFNTAFGLKSTTDLTEGSQLYFTTARVLTTPITGFVSGAGVVAATDTILQAINKLDGNRSALQTAVKTSVISYHLDGAGQFIGTGNTRYFVMPYSGTIVRWNFAATGTAPTCTIDIWKIAAGTALPAVANTIMGTKPALATGNAVRSTVLTGWTTAVTAGEIWAFNVDAIANALTLNFELEINRI